MGLFTVTYFAATYNLAAQKPFWFDELLTYNIAAMPTAGDVWRAWLQADDAMPPLVHFATHLSGSTLGFSHVTARLPAMVGFWLLCLCIFIFLRRRVCPMLALVGMLLPVTVPLVYSYAYEARAYGMVLGFCGAAVVCWDLASDARWRRVALLGLPIFLAGAIAAHTFAILVVVPLALAELARTLERRHVDWVVWMGLVAATLVILPVNPVVAHLRRSPNLAQFSVGRRANVPEVMEVWNQLLSTPANLLGLLALICIWRDRASPADDPSLPAAPGRQPSPADWVLIIGLMALPAIGWVFANLVTRLFPLRYVIATVIGFSLGVPLLCRMAIRRRPEIALLLAAWVVVAAAASPMSARHTMRKTLTRANIAAGWGCFRLLNLWKNVPQDGLPIVMSDFFVYHQIHHYAPEPLKQRMVFVVDREFGKLIEPSVPFYSKVFGEHMEGLEEFLRSHRSFYLYDCGNPAQSPMMERLLGAGATVRDGGLLDTPDILLRRDFYRVSLNPGT
ncbi:MAG: ArnT family glycosyltransferase [Candidatus Binatia bacterium]